MTTLSRPILGSMSKGELTRESVLSAIDEYDRLGRDAFLSAYGFGKARDYVLVHEGRQYDSKAIAGAAHRYQHGTALKPTDFSGGTTAAVPWLERLGFTIRSTRSPDWTRDEIILACALIADNGWQGRRPTDPRVVELSDLLQLLPVHPASARGATFRNANSVARKTFDIATRHPDYEGRPTNGGSLDALVLQDFLDSPLEMAAAAALIRAGILSGELTDRPTAETEVDEDLDDIEAPEGRILLKKHLHRERSRSLRKKKIDSVLHRGLRLACEACGFDFELAYGARGAGYIECHHVVPLHQSGAVRTKLTDLALICANCHRMIHRQAPWPTPRELRALMADTRTANALP
ncbi:HNH endonuclease [Kitasatospora sp. NPDC051853]|uniref:HNH endonuclease n=1 Tax=Kitasatospora sp. NPDC051853 TaxID=3364058 RepID=UPI0037BBD9EC